MISGSLAAMVAVSLLVAGPQPSGNQGSSKPSNAKAGPSSPGRPASAKRPPVDLIWLAGPPSNVDLSQPPPANTAKLRSLGARVYKQKCLACHGTWGDGKGPAANALDVPLPDFGKAIFKLRSTPSGTLPTPEDLFVTISRGMHGTQMFPWPKLSVSERWGLVYRVMSFSPRFKQEQPGTPFVVPSPPPLETPELIAQGKRLYERHRCGACHGDQGGADGPAAALYHDPSGQRPVTIRDFQRGQFLRGSEMEDVYLTLLTGLDGTPMGPYDALASHDLWALSAYVRDLVLRRRVQDPLPTGDKAVP